MCLVSILGVHLVLLSDVCSVSKLVKNTGGKLVLDVHLFIV